MKFSPSTTTELSEPEEFDIAAQHMAAKMGEDTEAMKAARQNTVPPGALTKALIRAITRKVKERTPTPAKFAIGSALIGALTLLAWGALTLASHAVGPTAGIYTALIFAAPAAAAAFWCLITAPKTGPGALYVHLHTAVLAGAALSAFEVVDMHLLATVTGPALAGYGLGSFVAVIFRAAKTA